MPKRVATEVILVEYKPPRVIDRDIRSFEDRGSTDRWSKDLDKYKMPVLPKKDTYLGIIPPMPRPRPAPDVVPEEASPPPPAR